jgi:hypothetical protein
MWEVLQTTAVALESPEPETLLAALKNGKLA